MEVSITMTGEYFPFCEPFDLNIGDRKLFVTVTSSCLGVSRWLHAIKRYYRKHEGHFIVGIRFHRPMIYEKKGLRDSKFSHIFLCIGSNILIYRDDVWESSWDDKASFGSPFPKPLREFFEDRKITFIGYNIAQDVKKFTRDRGVHIATVKELKPLALKIMESDRLEKNFKLLDLAPRLLGDVLDLSITQRERRKAYEYYWEPPASTMKLMSLEALICFEAARTTH